MATRLAAFDNTVEEHPGDGTAVSTCRRRWPGVQLQRQHSRAGAAAADDDTTPPNDAAAQRDDVPEQAEAVRKERQALTELMQAKLLRAVYSERQLEEVLVDFWFNHFNVVRRQGAGARLPHRVRARRDPAARARHVPRPAAGDGEEPGDALLSRQLAERGAEGAAHGSRRARERRAARDAEPHAGGVANAASRPIAAPHAGCDRRSAPPRGLNENYARELMELHTLGVDGGYTQKDVTKSRARSPAGRSTNPRQGGGFRFEPRMHDDGEKIVLGHTIKAGGGETDGEQVLDILAHAPVDGALHRDQAGAALRQPTRRRRRWSIARPRGSARPTATSAR